MLIAPDSPIRIRVDLDRRQALQLDAIAVAANVIDQTYRRLISSLTALPLDGSIEELLGDAWGLIDWIHRLDGLVAQCRGLSGRLPFVVDYRNASRLVETLRHNVQHLEGTIPEIEATGRAPWGHISWTVELEPAPGGARRFTQRAAGSSLIGATDEEFRMGKPLFPRTPIDNVSLYSADGDAEIGLTGQHEALLRFAPALEHAVASSMPPDSKGILRIRAA